MPDEDTLLEFLKNPDTLDYDLREQIAESVNCQRALFQLVEDRLRCIVYSQAAKANVAQLVKEGKVGKSEKKFSQTPVQLSPVTLPRPQGPFLFGQIWNFTGKVLVWTGTRLAKRSILLLQNAVIIKPAHKLPWGDEIVRVVPLQDEPLFPEYLWGDRDIEVQKSYTNAVVHPYLSFPMSTSQLYKCIENLGTEDAHRLDVSLQLIAGGKPLGDLAAGPRPDHNPDHARDAMEEVLADVSWFSATADALRLAAEQGLLQ